MNYRYFATALACAPAFLVLYYLLRRIDEKRRSDSESDAIAADIQTVEYRVNGRFVGSIIGHGGSTIRDVERKTGAKVLLQKSIAEKDAANSNNADSKTDTPSDTETNNTVNTEDAPCDERNEATSRKSGGNRVDSIVTIRGTKQQIKHAETAIRRAIVCAPVAIEEVIEVPTRCIGRLIGTRGESIQTIRARSGVRVNIERKSNVASALGPTDGSDLAQEATTADSNNCKAENYVALHESSARGRARTRIRLHGTYEQIRLAKTLIIDRLRLIFDDECRFAERESSAHAQTNNSKFRLGPRSNLNHSSEKFADVPTQVSVPVPIVASSSSSSSNVNMADVIGDTSSSTAVMQCKVDDSNGNGHCTQLLPVESADRSVSGSASASVSSELVCADGESESILSVSSHSVGSSKSKRRPRVNEALVSLQREASSTSAPIEPSTKTNLNAKCCLMHLRAPEKAMVNQVLVYVSCVYSPNCVLLQRCDTIAQLDALNLRLTQTYADNAASALPRSFRFERGMLVAAPFPTERERHFYRAVVRSEPNSANEVDLLYLDFGDHSKVRLCDVRPLAPVFLNEPFHAIECSLLDAAPVPAAAMSNGRAEWSDAAIDYLANITDCANRKQLVAHVCGFRQAQSEKTVLARLCSCDTCVVSNDANAGVDQMLFSTKRFEFRANETMKRANDCIESDSVERWDDDAPQAVTVAFLNAFTSTTAPTGRIDVRVPLAELLDVQTRRSVLDALVNAGYARRAMFA